MYMPAVNILFLSPLENVDFSLNLHIDNNYSYYYYVNGSGSYGYKCLLGYMQINTKFN